jgi:hypothetical protein
MKAPPGRLARALNARPDKWLPPAAYRNWRRKQANQARGERMTQEFIARAYAEQGPPPEQSAQPA